MDESSEQITVIKHLSSIAPPILFTVAKVGRGAGIGANIKFKQLGYRPGTPDIIVFAARGKFYGLFIEMKAVHGGQKSEAQKKFRAEALKAGYAHEFCKGARAAISVVDHYLSGAYPMSGVLATKPEPQSIPILSPFAQELQAQDDVELGKLISNA